MSGAFNLGAALLAAGLLAPGPAGAAECGTAWGGGPVPGTLASPARPCAPKPDTKTPAARETRPGTFRHGNTTIHVGGAVSVETGFGRAPGRR